MPVVNRSPHDKAVEATIKAYDEAVKDMNVWDQLAVLVAAFNTRFAWLLLENRDVSPQQRA